jgi:uncharacterized membrane protein YgcG
MHKAPFDLAMTQRTPMPPVLPLAERIPPSGVQHRAVVEPSPYIRETVRAILLASPAYQELDPVRRRALAASMVRVCQTAATLLRDEMESDALVQMGTGQKTAIQSPQPAPLAEAQAARGPRSRPGQSPGPPMAGQVATVARNILNAVSFPRFVAELINGVFKAMIDSSIQQMNAYVDLLNNVAASTEGFADANMSADQARTWLAERYPGSFEIAGPEPGEAEPGEAATRTLRLREGAALPSASGLRTSLGLSETDPTPSGDPESTLVPLARRSMARNRQQVLASMVMLGMQRIVIESGRIQASMRLHIDTRDAQNSDQGSIFSVQNRINAAGQVGVGIWGASASVQNNIAYVNTQRSQTTAEMNTDLELTSSVDIQFKSDYLPLNRLASPGQLQQIEANTRNPDAEAQTARAARRDQAQAAERARSERVSSVLTPPSAPEPPRPGDPGTPEHAARLQQEASGRDSGSGTSTGGSSGGGGTSTSSGSGSSGGSGT